MLTTELKKFDCLINGRLVGSKDGRYFSSINPSTGEAFAQLADCAKSDIEEAVKAARAAFDEGAWSASPLRERGAYLLKIAQLIREQAKDLAELESLDTGKTLKQTTFIDVPTAADTFEYFANAAVLLKGETIVVNEPTLSITQREPVGVVASIIPWNYPLIMAAWKIAPALITGNTLILKLSPLASVSVLRLAQLIQQAGLPKGVVNIVSSSRNQAGAELVAHPDVDMVSFTGSTKTGEDVMRLAAGGVKKLTLELGGKSPNIVFADCDLEAALGGAMSAIFMNQGQMCTAGSRLLVEDKIYDAFVAKLVERTKALKIGNALSYETDFGPVISAETRNRMLDFAAKGQKEGAKLLCGGQIRQISGELANGFYVEPTILEGTNAMSIAQEECFAPVLTVIKFSSLQEAVHIANDSKYGLAAMIWTKDLGKANTVAQKLRCGTVWINTYGAFYNEVPYGGYKQSGFGRELGREGLLEYTQTKHICTDQTPGGKSLVTSWF